jgi:hypothetical protein
VPLGLGIGLILWGGQEPGLCSQTVQADMLLFIFHGNLGEWIIFLKTPYVLTCIMQSTLMSIPMSLSLFLILFLQLFVVKIKWNCENP